MKEVFRLKRFRWMMIPVAISLFFTGIVAYMLCHRQVPALHRTASEALRAVLQEEVAKRENLVPNFFAGDMGSTNLTENEFPVEVTFTLPTGRKVYEVTCEEHVHNIDSFPQVRSFHSYLLQKYPLSIDTLGAEWNRKLREAGFGGKVFLRMCALDVETGKESTVCTGDSVALVKAETPVYWTIGYACEVRLTGFLSYQWWQLCSWTTMAWSFVFFVFFLLLQLWGIRRKFAGNKLALGKDGQPSVAAVPLQDSVSLSSSVIRLEDGTCFHKDQLLLRKGDREDSLTPLLAELLGLLIEAQGNAVSAGYLMEKLWHRKDEDYTPLYKAVCRLKEKLEAVSSLTIENKRKAYCLKLQDEEEKI